MSSRTDIESFVSKIDKDFNPPISEYYSIEQYVQKAYEKGDGFVAVLDGEIIGLLMFYANDFQNLEAYITFMGVDKSKRGLNIASSLLKYTIEKVKSLKFKCINVSTHNTIALRVYQNQGFCEEMTEYNFTRNITTHSLRLSL